jgi:DNA-binding FadR family transcriptional regulator
MPVVPFRAPARRRLHEDVAEQLRDAILDGRFAAGGKLPPERDLAVEFRVNRTSVREAIKVLESLGLVTVRQGDGATVRPLVDASLEVLGPMIFHRGRVDLAVVAEMAEVIRPLLLEMGRLAIERARQEDLAAIRGLRDRAADQTKDRAARYRALHDLLVVLADTTRNRVSQQEGLLLAWRQSGDRGFQRADRLVELEPPGRRRFRARRLRQGIELLVIFTTSRQPRHDSAAHRAPALHVANSVCQDAIEQRPPLLRAARGVRVRQLHHRVLHGIERVGVVAQSQLRDLECALLDAGEELLEGAACHQLLVPTPLVLPEGGRNGRVINAAEVNKRGHERCNAPWPDPLTYSPTPWRFRESGTYEHSRRRDVTSMS